MKKRILSLILVLALMAALSATAMAADVSYAVTGGSISFDIKTGTVTKCEASVTEAVIPASIYDVPVTAIGDNAFSGCKKLQSVTLPKTVTSIGYHAFYYCEALPGVVLPEGLISIGKEAFASCRALASVSLPNTLEVIGKSAFQSCRSLRSLTIPNSVTTLGESFCQACTGLETVHIGSGAEVLGTSSFEDCTALKTVTFETGLKRLNGYNFTSCKALESVRLPEGLEAIGAWTFRYCENLKNIYIPNSVNEIGYNAFGQCTSLKSIAIPEGVTQLGDYTFVGCKSLEKIGIPSSVTKIYDVVFNECSALTDIYYAGDIVAWSEIETGFSNDPLRAATLHLNSQISSNWAADYIDKAEEMGLIPDALVGQDLTQPVTRAEFAAISLNVFRAVTSSEPALPETNPFTDTQNEDVLRAYAVGITNGTGDGTVFKPDDLLNREQAATMLTRVFKKIMLSGWTLETDKSFDAAFKAGFTMPAPFGDDADISGWAKDSVYFMKASDIINGFPDGTFRPRAIEAKGQAVSYAQATREQVLKMAVQMVENLG